VVDSVAPLVVVTPPSVNVTVGAERVTMTDCDPVPIPTLFQHSRENVLVEAIV
jgi:hypothetical protein